MSPLLLLAGLALASPTEDLRVAADADVPVAGRMEAFDRLVRTGTTDIGLVAGTCPDVGADTRRRWVACRVLGKVGGARAKSTLEALLSDEEPAMRAVALQSMGDLGDPTLATEVASKLKDPAIMVRAAAAEALGKLGQPSTIPALAAALQAGDSWYRGSSLWVRRHYVVALGQIGHKDAVPALLLALDDDDPGVEAAAETAFESVAGFSYAEGRTEGEAKEAWRRWGQSQIR